MAELKASPRSPALGAIADALMRTRELGDRAKIPFTELGLGELLLGKTPEELNEWSYGNAPLRIAGRGTGSLVPQLKQGRAEQVADTMFTLPGAGPLTKASARAIRAVPSALKHGAQEFAHASAAANPRIIKDKGGNWLANSVENALSGLKPILPGYATERTFKIENARPSDMPNIALNNWIEGTLTKYVKRDMATDGDPVRKLAEQGITHVAPEQLYYSAREVHPSGDVLQKLGQSPTARAWENASDYAVASFPAKIYQNFGPNNLGLDWVNKLDPKTPFYRPYGKLPSDLGFSHLTDELANALNPESGLPRQLLLTPEQMQQMGMEKAVRHVANINAWRAAQQAEANLAKSQSPAVHMVREYAENNPKGLRWVELKPSGELKYNNTPENKAIRDQLQEQLKHEGDTMGHCVGGYCDDVASGKSRIFSLRDAKGEPHVTIEARPGEVESIVQIKGKQNLKPKDEYLPFVQDFVRNHPEGGKWGDVGDFRNTGLERLLDYQENVQRAAREKYPEMEYLTAEELQPFIDAQFQPKQNFARGGPVEADDDFAYPGMF